MNRIRLVFAFVLYGLVATRAAAEHPDLFRQYRFLPRHSTLTEFRPGAEVDFTVRGTFGLVTSFHHDHDPWLGQSAQFVDVDAWASHPFLAYVLFLDDVLNLSGLDGRQLPVGAPFDVFKFEGQTDEGSDVQLIASVIDPWFLVNGETTPPAGSEHIFPYKFHAVARQRPFADFNDDAVVDAADLEIWSAYAGATSLLGDATNLGDADGDHDVDGADYLAWQQHVGERAPGASVASSLAVPEPASLVLLAAGVALLTGMRRR